MDDYIKRSDAMKVIETANSMASSLLEATMKLCVTMDRIAAADVRPVVRGRWIDTGSGQECSVCKEIQCGYDTGRYYCPNCGARMDGDGDV